MSAKDIVSTVLLLFGVVIGPAIFLITMIVYAVRRTSLLVAEYRERCYLQSLPCANCRYFANDELLPCAVNPLQVLTDEAHHCYDFSQTKGCEATNGNNSYLRTLLNNALILKRPQSPAGK